MSATTELLLQQIKEQEDAIRAAAEQGHDTAEMCKVLKSLNEQLNNANKVLSESKTVLKG